MLMPWNAAANLWHRARKPAPMKRKTHAPIGDAKLNVFTNTQPPPGDRRYSLVPDAQRRDELGEWMACQDCGCHECGCEQRFEMQQEAQRAQLARAVDDLGNNRRPPVQQHLRHGDPRRMSLGYNERDYDESRRVNIKAMKAEGNPLALKALAGIATPEEIERGRVLAYAVHEHQSKLPVMPKRHQDSTPKLPARLCSGPDECFGSCPKHRCAPYLEDGYDAARREELDKFRQKMADATLQYLKAGADRAVLMTNIGVSDSRELLALESELAAIEKL